MKIIFVSLMTSAPWGGSEELWFRAARLALRQGHSVSTITARWPTVPAPLAELAELGATTAFYHEPPVSLLSKVLRHLRRPAASPPPLVVPAPPPADVVVFSNGSTWDFVRFRFVADQLWRPGTPFVLLSQHSFEHGHIMPAADRTYAQAVMGQAQACFFVAERNRAAAERQLAAPIPRARLIGNPVPTPPFAAQPFPASPTLRLACVARLDCQFKGQDLLLHALNGPPWANRDYQLTLFGDGPHHAYLQALVVHYGLQAQVRLAGYTPDVAGIWASQQALVLPSLSEGTPLVLLEAMLAGRPALATDVGGNARYVRPGHTGFLVPAGSVEGLRAGLEDLWQARAELPALGQNARTHALAISDLAPEATLLRTLTSGPDHFSDGA